MKALPTDQRRTPHRQVALASVQLAHLLDICVASTSFDDTVVRI